jgi:hypothetical protein
MLFLKYVSDRAGSPGSLMDATMTPLLVYPDTPIIKALFDEFPAFIPLPGYISDAGFILSINRGGQKKVIDNFIFLK